MNSAYVVTLNQNLDVNQARLLHKELERALADHRSILLVGDDVAKISTASLQVLLSFITEASAQKIEWRWQTTPSSAFLDVLELCGLTSHFELKRRTT